MMHHAMHNMVHEVHRNRNNFVTREFPRSRHSAGIRRRVACADEELMGELADLFELMHGAPESFRTLRAAIRDRRDYEPSRRSRAERFEESDPEGWAAYVAEGGYAG